MLPRMEQFRESFKWHFFKPAKKALVIYIFTIIPELIIAYLIAIREEYSVKNRNYFNRLIEIHGEYVLVYNSRARRTSLKGTAKAGFASCKTGRYPIGTEQSPHGAGRWATYGVRGTFAPSPADTAMYTPEA